MPVVCSFCHMRFDQQVEEGEAVTGHVVCHSCVCPRCKAEAGIEPVKGEPPLPMKLFGTMLAAAGFLVVVISGLFVSAN